jgi:hypothetical protein
LHGLITHKNILIPILKKNEDPLSPPHYAIFGQKKGGIFKNYPLMSMGGQAEGLASADPRARTTIGVSGNSNCLALAVYRNIHDLIPTIEIS